MSATIKDVAKKANVSVATVSRVINNNGYVHEDTKKLILQAIEELNYTPNQYARFLSGSKTKIIGVLVPHIGTPFYGLFLEGLEYAAHSKGFKIMLANTNDNEKIESEYIEIFKNYNVDGIIAASNILNVEQLLSFNKPIVTVDHVLSDEIPSITSNNVEGGKLAAQELINSGCKNIYVLRGPSFLITTIERTHGFLAEMEKHPEINVEMDDFDLLMPDTNYIQEYIKNHPQIDGIFAMSDTLALIAASRLHVLNKRIPEDCAIVGYDNIIYSKFCSPALTTIEQPIKYLGIQAFNTIVKLIAGEKLTEAHQVINVNIKKRESTK